MASRRAAALIAAINKRAAVRRAWPAAAQGRKAVQCLQQTKHACSGDVVGVHDEIYTVLVHRHRDTHCHLASAALPLCAVLSE